MRTKVMLAANLVILLAAGSAFAQHTLIVKIDFPFTVEGKVLPAGEYEFVGVGTAGVEAFSIRSAGKGVATVPVLTHLAGEMHTTPQDAHVVFDVVGDTHMLSEIWLVGEDGYLVLATKGPHKHKVLNIKR